MTAYLARRVLDAALVCVAVSMATFALVHIGGDVAVSMGGMEASPADVARIRAYYGLDRSLPDQYLGWLSHVLEGDLGQSFFSKEDVTAMILDRLPVTVVLALGSLALALAVGVPLGVAAAVRRDGWPDRLCLVLTTLAQAMPAYWTGLLLILLFGVRLQALPISGTDSWASFVMPILALGWFVMPVIARLTRAGMLEVLGADFIRAARAKGLAPRAILLRHALRNAIMPVVSVSMVQFGYLLGGSIVVESVFALNGIGLLAWSAILRSDFPVVQGIVVIVALVFVLLTLAADVVNGLLDPRLRQ
jgi:ABC-type dipeptide/oligopeptide/nickel transport system permease component